MSYQDRRSFTQLTTYLDCGEQYRLKYLDRVREVPAVWSIGGTAFHSCAEWLLKGDLDPAEEHISNAWEVAWQLAHAENAAKLPPGTDPDPETWRKAGRGAEGPKWWGWHGRKMVAQFVDWWTHSGLKVFDVVTDDGDVVPGIEHELLVTLGGVDVRAIPDALVLDEHGQLDVLDYKSGNARGVTTKDPFQLAVYSVAVEVALGVKPTFGLFYGTRMAQAYPHDLTRWTPDLIGEKFADFDAKERAGIYKPNPGKRCSYCGVRDSCTYKENA